MLEFYDFVKFKDIYEEIMFCWNYCENLVKWCFYMMLNVSV